MYTKAQLMNLLIVLPCCGHCSKLNFKLLHKYKLLYQATELDDSPLVINVALQTSSGSQRENVFTEADVILKINPVLDDKLVFESLGKTHTHKRLVGFNALCKYQTGSIYLLRNSPLVEKG